MSDLPLPEPAEPQALDIQHDTDPAEDHGPARRIPHLGHAILLFSIAIFYLAACITAVFDAAHLHTAAEIADHPKLRLLSQALSYVFTLATAFWLFPRLWRRRFLHGIQWNVLAAHRRWFYVVPAGVLLSIAAQFADRFVPPPPKGSLELFFKTPLDAWLVTAFGILLVPIVEEIAFRGFLLPALATAYDWLALDRTPAGLRKWETSALHSTPALIFGAVFSSFAFAFIHGDQLSYSWGSLAVLFGVSLGLSYARIKTHSVACSALMHAAYNLTIFATAFITTGAYRHLDKLNS
jgi:membrane protease YdiL (CAAX protease family)